MKADAVEGGLEILAEPWRWMQEEVSRHAPEEACGLLAGREGRAWAVLPVSNALHSPVRFRMDAREQLRAMTWIEGQGLELVGIYHSHPQGPPAPSATDLAEYAYPGVLYVIWFRSGQVWQARAFAIEAGAARQVGLHTYEK